MTEYRLISHHLCPYVQRAVIVLTEKEVPHERTYIDLSDKPDWFRSLSPLGRVPVLQAGDAVLFESQVIAEYLDEVTPGSLHPADALERARHRAWIEFASDTLQRISGFYGARDPAAFERSRSALKANFQRLEREIEGPFFAGPAFHMIDGVWGTVFHYFDVFDTVGDFDILAGLHRIRIWRSALAQRPSVAGAAPEGYADSLKTFLERRDSHLSSLIRAGAGAAKTLSSGSPQAVPVT